jgi:hypothetical protein
MAPTRPSINSHLREQRQSFVVVNHTACQNTAVTGIGVGAEADIGRDKKLLAEFILQHFDGAVDDGIVAQSRRCCGILCFRNAEEHYPFDAKFEVRSYGFDERVGGFAEDSGHTGNFEFDIFAFTDEIGLDHAAKFELRFRRHIADELIDTQATWPIKDIMHLLPPRAGLDPVRAIQLRFPNRAGA